MSDNQISDKLKGLILDLSDVDLKALDNLPWFDVAQETMQAAIYYIQELEQQIERLQEQNKSLDNLGRYFARELQSARDNHAKVLDDALERIRVFKELFDKISADLNDMYIRHEPTWMDHAEEGSTWGKKKNESSGDGPDGTG